MDGQRPPHAIQHCRVDRKSHPHRMDRGARRQQDPIPRRQGAAELKPAKAAPKAVGNHQPLDQDSSGAVNFQLPVVHRLSRSARSPTFRWSQEPGLYMARRPRHRAHYANLKRRPGRIRLRTGLRGLGRRPCAAKNWTLRLTYDPAPRIIDGEWGILPRQSNDRSHS